MRTSTAAWAAALAVMSMSGPFTTAKAAPARRVEQEQPRPIYGKLRRRQGFNDSDTPDPNPLNAPPIPPLLGGSSTTPHADPTPPPDPSRSDPEPKPDHEPPTLTSSTSRPADPSPAQNPDRSGDRPADSQDPPKPTPSDSNPVDPLLSSLLHHTSDFSFSLAPPRVEPSSSPQRPNEQRPDQSSSETTTSRDQTGSDPLLGSITAPLSNVLPDPTRSSGPIRGTGNSGPEQPTPNLLSNLPVQSVLPSRPLGNVPDQASSFLAHGTGNSPRPTDQQSTRPDDQQTTTRSDGGILPGSILPSGLGHVPSVLPSIPPIGTAVSRLPTPSDVRSIVSSIQSDVPPVVHPGTGNLGSILPTITGTGGLPVVSDLPSVIPTDTRPLGSIVPPITGTGGQPIKSVLPTILPTGTRPLGSDIPPIPNPVPSDIPPIPNPVPSDIPPVTPPGISGPATGTAPLPIPTLNSIIPTVPLGTGGLSVQPPVVTATVGDSTVTIAAPTISVVATAPVVTAPPGSTSNASPGAVTPSANASGTVASDPEPTNSAQVSQPATASNDTVPAESKTKPPSISAAPTPAASTKPSAPPVSVEPQVSIVATGTDTQTSLTLPTTWSFAPSPSDKTAQGSTGIATAVSTTLSSVGIPTTMARLVQPPGGMPNPPVNSTLVQIGFRFGLNYPFVVGKPESASQIFAYLPEGIAYGLGITKDRVLMNALMPYDTSKTLGYITTLAQTYIPHDLVDELQLNLHAPASPIYANPSAPVNALMNQVNPTIPNIPGANLDDSLSSSSFDPAATTIAGEADGAPIGGDAGSSKKVLGTSAAIGMGAIAGAAVYAAAMIYVARRYRQRRKGHVRVSSVPTAGEMTQRSSGGMGSMFMSGGVNGRTSPRGSASNSGGRGSRTSNGSSNGRSVREQGISAPLMSENSLGWN